MRGGFKMEYEIRRADELTHWGVRGMKWGVRRYQNKDGSLTPRGKKRYEAELKKVREQEKVLKNRQATRAKIEKLEARKKAAADEQDALDAAEGKNKKHKLFGRKAKAEETPKKTINDMSDVELFEAINRARMEDTYRQLRPEVVEKSKPFKKLIDDVVTPAATNAGKQFLENALKQAGAKLLEGKVDPDSLQALTLMRDKLKMKNEIEKLKKNEPEEKSAKEKLTEVQYEKAKMELDNAKRAAEAEAKTAEQDRKTANKYNKARTEFISKAAGDSIDTSNVWERKARSVNEAIDWDSTNSTGGKPERSKRPPAPSVTGNTPVTRENMHYPTQAEWDKFVQTYRWGDDTSARNVDKGRRLLKNVVFEVNDD
jgi:hypothetical protein